MPPSIDDYFHFLLRHAASVFALPLPRIAFFAIYATIFRLFTIRFLFQRLLAADAAAESPLRFAVFTPRVFSPRHTSSAAV